MAKFLDQSGLEYLWSRLRAMFADKVDKVSGKGLSSNDLTAALKNRYDAAHAHSQTAHAPAGAERNEVMGVQVNGADLTPDAATRKINVAVPTGALASKNKVAQADLETALATKVTAAEQKSHSHPNKTVLDKITQANLDDWNSAEARYSPVEGSDALNHLATEVYLGGTEECDHGTMRVIAVDTDKEYVSASLDLHPYAYDYEPMIELKGGIVNDMHGMKIFPDGSVEIERLRNTNLSTYPQLVDPASSAEFLLAFNNTAGNETMMGTIKAVGASHFSPSQGSDALEHVAPVIYLGGRNSDSQGTMRIVAVDDSKEYMEASLELSPYAYGSTPLAELKGGPSYDSHSLKLWHDGSVEVESLRGVNLSKYPQTVTSASSANYVLALANASGTGTMSGMIRAVPAASLKDPVQNYTTAEAQMPYKWIDGQIVYRQVITLIPAQMREEVSPQAGPGEGETTDIYIYTAAGKLSGIKEILPLGSSMLYTTGGNVFPLCLVRNYGYYDAGYAFYPAGNGNYDIVLYSGQRSKAEIAKVMFIVYYTKA